MQRKRLRAVKLEPADGTAHLQQAHAAHARVKREPTWLAQQVKGEIKDEVKDDTQEEVKDEVKHEPEHSRIKREFKHEIKDEVKREVKGEIKQELKLEMKEEACELEQDFGRPLRIQAPCRVKREIDIQDPSSYEARVPLWIMQCVRFQVAKRTWAPARPCCLPNCFVEPLAPPPRSDLKSCYHRLTERQKKEFRAFVMSCEGSQSQRPIDMKGTWDQLLHPERHCLTNADSQPQPFRRRRKLSYNFDLDPIGGGWYWDGREKCFKRMGASWCPPGGGVFEGRGQADAGTRLDRDHAIGEEGVAAQPESSDPRRSRAVPWNERQSGVQYVSWNEKAAHWDVNPRIRAYRRKFTMLQYKTANLTIEQAIETARQAAVQYLKDLVWSGVVKEPEKPVKEPIRSNVIGVCWDKKRKTWRVRMRFDGKRVQRSIAPACQTPAEIEKARLEAERVCHEIEAEHGVQRVGVRTEAKKEEDLVKRFSGDRGVTWSTWEEAWRVSMYIKGKYYSKRFAPQAGACEDARRQAVAFCQALRASRDN